MRKLHIRGKYFYDDLNRRITFRGVNAAGFEWNFDGCTSSKVEVWDTIKDWKANIVRLPFAMNWVLESEEYRQKLDRIIQMAEEREIYVLLDCHWMNQIDCIAPLPFLNEWLQMWKMLALRYKDNPNVLIDIYNEPHDCDLNTWIDYAQQCYDAIREVNQEVIIFIPTDQWGGGPINWVKIKPIIGENIAYTVHFYYSKYNKYTAPLNIEEWRQVALNNGWKYILDNNIAPLVMGEFCFFSDLGEEFLEKGWDCIESLIHYMEQEKMSYIFWDFHPQACPCLIKDDDTYKNPSIQGELAMKYLKLNEEKPYWIIPIVLLGVGYLIWKYL